MRSDTKSWVTIRKTEVGGGAGEWAKLAPLRILSVDIECAGRKVRCPPLTSRIIVPCSEETLFKLFSFWQCTSGSRKNLLDRAEN